MYSIIDAALSRARTMPPFGVNSCRRCRYFYTIPKESSPDITIPLSTFQSGTKGSRQPMRSVWYALSSKSLGQLKA